MEALATFESTQAEWNAVSRAVAADKKLKRRVLKQASLYGLASAVDSSDFRVDGVASVPPLRAPVAFAARKPSLFV